LRGDPDGDRIGWCLVGTCPAHRVDSHLVDLDAEHLVTLERPDRLPPLLRVPVLGIGARWRGVPLSRSPDVDGGLPTGDGPELAAIALLARLALANDAAHLVPPDTRRGPRGSGRGAQARLLQSVSSFFNSL